MPLVTCHDGRLYTSKPSEVSAATRNGFVTGLPAIDDLMPGGALARGAVHELLTEPGHGLPLTFAVILARAASVTTQESPAAPPRDNSRAQNGAVVWCDPDSTLYPPAVAARGIPLHRLYILRPRSAKDLVWSTAECLACRGVSATVAPLGRLSRVEARRLQLAVERGGGVGLLLRPFGKASAEYAAATRWLVAPYPGGRTTQCWKIQLIHGHGGRVGQSVILEYDRESAEALSENPVRAFEELADRPAAEGTRGRQSSFGG
jgi:protein ImuA